MIIASPPRVPVQPLSRLRHRCVVGLGGDARVEVVRAISGGGPAAIAHARRQLARVDEIAIDRGLIETAATIAPGERLRSLDAIRLASTQALAPDLRAVVTYDQRMAAAGHTLRMTIEAPK
jgi:uncharacterized protein